MNDYDMSFHYHQGKGNVVDDALSILFIVCNAHVKLMDSSQRGIIVTTHLVVLNIRDFYFIKYSSI